MLEFLEHKQSLEVKFNFLGENIFMTEDTQTDATKIEDLKDWTIMIYLAGDNDLNQDTIDAIKGLKSNNSNPLSLTSKKIALLAYYDPSTISYPTLYCDFTHKHSVNANGDSSVTIETYQTTFGSSLENGEESNEESIYRFVKWCVETQGHKAKNYALILSGHGYGFQKDTFLRDSNPGTFMTPKGLADKLKRINRWILNEDDKNDKKFSIIGLDSCVMSTIEFANQLSGVGETLIASQGLIPSTGWNYKHIVQQINDQQEKIEAQNKETSEEKSITNGQLSKIIADSFITSNYENAFFGDRSIDISCCNLERIPKTSGLVHSLGRLLLFALNSPLKKKILRAILTSHQVCQKHILDQCVDLKDFCFNLKEECDSLILENTTNLDEISKIANTDIDSNSDNIITRLQKSNKFLGFISTNCSGIIQSIEGIEGNDEIKGVTSNFNYLGSEYQYSNGLSLYFPWSYLSYRKTLPRYLEHQFAAQDFMDSGWLERQFYRFKNTSLENKDEKKEKIKKDLKEIHEHRFTPNFWTMFLEYYLFSTLRNVRSSAKKAYYLYSPEGESLDIKSLNDPRFRLNPLNKIWDDYDKGSWRTANLWNHFLKNEDSRFESYKHPSIEFEKLSGKSEIETKDISWFDEKWNDDNWLDESQWTENKNWFVNHDRWSKVDKWSSKDDKWKFDDNGVWTKVETNSEDKWSDNWSEDENKWASSNDEWFNSEKWTAKVDKWSKVDRWTAKVDRWTAKVDRWTAKVDKWTSRDDRWTENNTSDFAKTNNFPWAPRFWQPSENVINLWKENKPSKHLKSSSVSEDENDNSEAT
jgi:Clostripain family